AVEFGRLLKIWCKRKLHLKINYICSICSADLGSHEIVDVPQRCFAVFNSGGRLLSHERSESFSLRHNASRFHHNETSRHCGCNSRSDVSAPRSRPKVFGPANGGAASGTALGSISLR